MWTTTISKDSNMTNHMARKGDLGAQGGGDGNKVVWEAKEGTPVVLGGNRVVMEDNKAVWEVLEGIRYLSKGIQSVPAARENLVKSEIEDGNKLAEHSLV